MESVTPWKQVDAFDYGQQEIGRQHVIGLVRFVPRDLVKQAVQPLPLVRADLFAYLARVLAGRGHAGGDRRTVARIEGKDLRHLVSIAAPGQVGRIAQRRQNPPPAAVRARGGLIQHQVQIHVEQAGGVLGPLQVAAHPVQAVGDAREHGCISDSIGSEPRYLCCRRLATNSPPAIRCRSATRVRPPGTMVTLSPNRM